MSIDYKYLTSCFVSQTDIINASPLPSRAIDQLQSKVGGTIIVSFHSLHPPHSDLSSVPIQEPPPLASIGPSEPRPLALASGRGVDGPKLRKTRPPALIKICVSFLFSDPVSIRVSCTQCCYCQSILTVVLFADVTQEMVDNKFVWERNGQVCSDSLIVFLYQCKCVPGSRLIGQTVLL